MRDDFQVRNVKTIWREQPRETGDITMSTIRQYTEKLHRKTRTDLVRGIAASLLAAGIAGAGVVYTTTPLLRTMFAIAIVWTFVGQYFIRKKTWAHVPFDESTPNTGLETYRRQVQLRIGLSNGWLLWLFGPLALAVTGVVTQLLVSFNGALLKMGPFLSMLGLWLIGVFVSRMRECRELQREVERLKELEGGS